MTHLTDTTRELSREADGRFGIQEHSAPETELTAPSGTFEIPADELNAGDTILIDGRRHLVHATWVLDFEPETRIAETDSGDLRLDREDDVTVVRTGDEPKPEENDQFFGYCHSCGEAFAENHNHTTFHIHPRGGRHYALDTDHTPFSLDSFDE